jgi:hypothetical protein
MKIAKQVKKVEIQPIINKLLYWSIFVFIVKLIIISNISSVNFQFSDGRIFQIDNIWLGADGGNYLKGYEAILKDGIFSSEPVLNYWPAGYPLLMFLLSLLGKSWVLTTLSILQSVIFSYACFFFCRQLLNTRLRKIAFFVFIIIIFNPTLTLSSLVIGYESLVASGILISIGLILKDINEKNNSKLKKYLVLYSLISGFIIFMQPRFIISCILTSVIWLVYRLGPRLGSISIIASLIITLILPASLIYRNNIANGITSISTNLGNTMNIGAGENASGGYQNDAKGVDCTTSGSISQQDSQKVKCVLTWYLQNPVKSLQLFYNKSIYFWSPWSGPLVEGTMVRNPWLKINPIINITSNEDGFNLVYGNFGKIISWLWMLSGLGLLALGFRRIWILGEAERVLVGISGSVILSNWLITLVTIGDHRFRLPIMGITLFIQAVGLVSIFKGKSFDLAPKPALR